MILHPIAVISLKLKFYAYLHFHSHSLRDIEYITHKPDWDMDTTNERSMQVKMTTKFTENIFFLDKTK